MNCENSKCRGFSLPGLEKKKKNIVSSVVDASLCDLKIFDWHFPPPTAFVSPCCGHPDRLDATSMPFFFFPHQRNYREDATRTMLAFFPFLFTVLLFLRSPRPVPPVDNGGGRRYSFPSSGRANWAGRKPGFSFSPVFFPSGFVHPLPFSDVRCYRCGLIILNMTAENRLERIAPRSPPSFLLVPPIALSFRSRQGSISFSAILQASIPVSKRVTFLP